MQLAIDALHLCIRRGANVFTGEARDSAFHCTGGRNASRCMRGR